MTLCSTTQIVLVVAMTQKWFTTIVVSSCYDEASSGPIFCGKRYNRFIKWQALKVEVVEQQQQLSSNAHVLTYNNSKRLPVMLCQRATLSSKQNIPPYHTQNSTSSTKLKHIISTRDRNSYACSSTVSRPIYQKFKRLLSFWEILLNHIIFKL